MTSQLLESFEKLYLNNDNDNKWICYQVIEPNFNLIVDLFGSYLTYNNLIKYVDTEIKSIQIIINTNHLYTT